MSRENVEIMRAAYGEYFGNHAEALEATGLSKQDAHNLS
jgi:hypothetical protein